MDDKQKSIILQEANSHLQAVTYKIAETKSRIDSLIVKLRTELVKARGEERDTKEILLYNSLHTERNMVEQHKSPYFVRCEVKFDDEPDVKTLYFGKFPYTAESIYSWVASASTIRFEKPGRFSYETPSGDIRQGVLLRKDQFMIVNGKIFFMSYEGSDVPRELIYQEYFSQKKSEFSLKEIVEQMEKAQDTIIRSHYFGSFLISGPAGSGKTTLALHRAAFLIQSPDTADLFPAKQVIIFVHDETTKNYFSSLLPHLGIHNATITTFHEWAFPIVQLQNHSFVSRFGKTEHQRDIYEDAKNRALKSIKLRKSSSDAYKTLLDVYRDYLDDELLDLFVLQKKKKIIDRFDLSVLLLLMIREKGELVEMIEKFVKQINGRYVKKRIKQPVKYSLIVLDEAENYLSEQITIIKSTINPKTNGMIYVGDLIQRTLPFTISDWKEVQESFPDDRKVVLQKVYRNTKEILGYIESVGYTVTIPENARSGKEVHEYMINSKEQEIAKVRHILKTSNDSVIGILAKSEEYLLDFKKAFSEYKNLHILTISESQGVEFNTVCIVGITKEAFTISGLPNHLKTERKRVDRDLLYVALTRAMNKLHIFGTTSLRDILN